MAKQAKKTETPLVKKLDKIEAEWEEYLEVANENEDGHEVMNCEGFLEGFRLARKIIGV